MKNKTISLSDEIFNKLKEVDNASALINKLCENHFLMSGNSKDDLIKKKEEAEKIYNTIMNKATEDLKKIEIKIKEVETIEEQNATIEDLHKQAQQEKILNCINNAREMFNFELTEDQAIDFLSSTEFNTIKGYIDFLTNGSN